MFGVGLPEMAVILVVAAIVFGPDKLPDYARQAARMLRQLRALAQSAQQDLRDELGPDYADLKLADLDPRVAIRRHILDALDEDDLDLTGRNGQPSGPRNPLRPGERPPYDAEAT